MALFRQVNSRRARNGRPGHPLREPFAKASPLGKDCLLDTSRDLGSCASRLKPPSKEDPQGMPLSLDAFSVVVRPYGTVHLTPPSHAWVQADFHFCCCC
jgi:hypothetical protein